MDDTLINYGGEMKVLGETEDAWKIGGWAVVFDTHDASALKDLFAADTDYDFENGEHRSIYYNHGLDGTIKATRIGRASLELKDAGVWYQGEVKKRTDYLKVHAEKIVEGIKNGLFGTSTGAPAHLVRREKIEGGHAVKLWPISEISITPTPAEPLTSCVSLKSLDIVELEEELKAKAKVGEWRRINEANVQIGGPIHDKITGKKPDDSASGDSGKDDKKKPDTDGKDGKDGKDKADSKKPDSKDDKADKPKKKLPKSQADLAKRIRTGSAELMELQRSMRHGYRAGQSTAEQYAGKSIEDEELVDVSDEDYAVFEAVTTGEAKGIDGLSPWVAIDAARRSLLSLNEDATGQITQLMHPDHKEYRRETEDFYTPTSEQRMEGIRKILSDYVTTAQALIETMTRNAQVLAAKSLEITNEELPAGLSFEDHSAQVLDTVGVYVKRVEGLADLRCVKSNRPWSEAKYAALTHFSQELKSVAAGVDGIAEAHKPRSEAVVDNTAVTQALAKMAAVKARTLGVSI